MRGSMRLSLSTVAKLPARTWRRMRLERSFMVGFRRFPVNQFPVCLITEGMAGHNCAILFATLNPGDDDRHQFDRLREIERRLLVQQGDERDEL